MGPNNRASVAISHLVLQWHPLRAGQAGRQLNRPSAAWKERVSAVAGRVRPRARTDSVWKPPVGASTLSPPCDADGAGGVCAAHALPYRARRTSAQSAFVPSSSARLRSVHCTSAPADGAQPHERRAYSSDAQKALFLRALTSGSTSCCSG